MCMRIVALLGLLLAVGVGVVGMVQISGLQDLSKGTVPASVDSLFGTTTFIWLLLVVAILVMMVTGAVAFFLKR